MESFQLEYSRNFATQLGSIHYLKNKNVTKLYNSRWKRLETCVHPLKICDIVKWDCFKSTRILVNEGNMRDNITSIYVRGGCSDSMFGLCLRIWAIYCIYLNVCWCIMSVLQCSTSSWGLSGIPLSLWSRGWCRSGHLAPAAGQSSSCLAAAAPWFHSGWPGWQTSTTVGSCVEKQPYRLKSDSRSQRCITQTICAKRLLWKITVKFSFTLRDRVWIRFCVQRSLANVRTSTYCLLPL